MGHGSAASTIFLPSIGPMTSLYSREMWTHIAKHDDLLNDCRVEFLLSAKPVPHIDLMAAGIDYDTFSVISAVEPGFAYRG